MTMNINNFNLKENKSNPNFYSYELSDKYGFYQITTFDGGKNFIASLTKKKPIGTLEKKPKQDRFKTLDDCLSFFEKN